MSRQITAAVRSACLRPDDRLTLISFGCGPVVDPLLFATNHFCAVIGVPGQKRPDKIPAPNVTLLDGDAGDSQIPLDLQPNVIVTAHEERKMMSARALSGPLGIPIICFWCKPPEANFTQARLQYAASYRGDYNIFLSKGIAEAWRVDGIVMPDEDIRPLLYAAARSPFVLRH